MKYLFAILISLALFGFAHAQSDDEMTRVSGRVTEKINSSMHGWTHRSIQPITGSKNVIIEQWQSSDLIVEVAITRYPDGEQAKRGFNFHKTQLAREEAAQKSRGKQVKLIKEELDALGDEAFVSDVQGSEAVAFRTGRFLVNISVPSPATNRDGFFSRQLAHRVFKALKDE